MKKKTMSLTFERMIPAAPGKVFDAWLNPKTPGTPWHEKNDLIFNPKVKGLWYWLIQGNSHYGRFTTLQRPTKIQTTWMSQSTLGEESTVTLTFKKKGDGTLLTLVHSDLPKAEIAKNHEGGWNYFLNKLVASWKK